VKILVLGASGRVGTLLTSKLFFKGISKIEGVSGQNCNLFFLRKKLYDFKGLIINAVGQTNSSESKTDMYESNVNFVANLMPLLNPDQHKFWHVSTVNVSLAVDQYSSFKAQAEEIIIDSLADSKIDIAILRSPQIWSSDWGGAQSRLISLISKAISRQEVKLLNPSTITSIICDQCFLCELERIKLDEGGVKFINFPAFTASVQETVSFFANSSKNDLKHGSEFLHLREILNRLNILQ
jgi:hypothetical protein